MRELGYAGTWAQKPLKRLVVLPAYLTSTSGEARMRILRMYLLREKPFCHGTLPGEKRTAV